MKFPFFKKGISTVIHQPAALRLASSSIDGLGVFTDVVLEKGSLIEIAPIITGTAQDYEVLSKTSLRNYYFVLADKQTPMAIGLGYASWYNHACPANASYTINLQKRIIEIRAIVNIKAGTEIFINYNGAFNDDASIEF